MILNINGVELPLELTDADVLDTVQSAIEDMVITEDKKSDNIGDVIRQPCIMIDGLFNKIWGDGASEAVFKGKFDIKEHMDAYIQVVEAIEKGQKEIEVLTQKYSKFAPNKKAKAKPVTNKRFKTTK